MKARMQEYRSRERKQLVEVTLLTRKDAASSAAKGYTEQYSLSFFFPISLNRFARRKLHVIGDLFILKSKSLVLP